MSVTTTELGTAVRSSAVPYVRKAASRDDVSAIGGTLSRAFFTDPVLTWSFPDPERRWRTLPALFELYADVFLRQDETYLTAGFTGAALWLPPEKQLLDEAEEADFGQQLEELAGVDAGRLFELLALLDEHHPSGSYWVLQLLGVEPQWQGRGVGSALLAPVLARADAEQRPAYLEATSRQSVPLYERHGFEIVGELSLPAGPSLYPMWREPA
jgi:GNAT superfamily N-acetyltransferase